MRKRDIRALARSWRAACKQVNALKARCANCPGIVPEDEVQAAEREAREWEHRIVYLVRHLDRRHDAKLLADAAGIPGYINTRSV